MRIHSLEFSTFKDAMASIERQFDGAIPTYRGDFGPYWEDGFTSDAQATAIHRANQQRLLNAETMGTIPSLLESCCCARIRPCCAMRGRTRLLFDEHTWTAAGATTQPESDETMRQWESKRAQAVRAGNDLTQSIERSFAQMEAMLAPKDNSLVIFNALNWTRSGWLETDLPEGKEIVDPQTQSAVPQEVLRVEQGTPLPGFGGRTLRVRYRADNVPAVGFKLLSVVDARVEDCGDAGEGGSRRGTGEPLLSRDFGRRKRLDSWHMGQRSETRDGGCK